MGAAAKYRTDVQPHEPAFVHEARWMASTLSEALAAGDDQLALALIDSGGPRWSGALDDFQRLDADERARVLDNIEDLSVVTARSIVRRGREEAWEDLLSEVVDPYARLEAFSSLEKQDANARIDLLVHRGAKSPLVVDLKSGVAMPAVDRCVDTVAADYGQHAANVLGRRVSCLVLGIDFHGRCRWSKTVRVLPSR